MIDVKAVQLKEFAKITSAEFLNREEVEKMFLPELGSALPSIIRLTGENFDRATDVIINGVTVQFSILSRTMVLATLPITLARATITSLQVLNDRENFSNTSMFSFEFGKHLDIISGLNKVIAQFIKVLMTTPGSDSFDKTLGGGLQKLPGSTSRAPYAALTKVALMLVNTAVSIQQRQFNLSIPNEEKLQSVEVLYIDFVKGDTTSIDVKIKVNTLAKTNIPISLTLGVKSLIESLTE